MEHSLKNRCVNALRCPLPLLEEFEPVPENVVTLIILELRLALQYFLDSPLHPPPIVFEKTDEELQDPVHIRLLHLPLHFAPDENPEGGVDVVRAQFPAVIIETQTLLVKREHVAEQ